MFKRSKYKKGSLARAVPLSLAALVIGVYGAIGFSPLMMSVSAQEAEKPPAQSQFCEEANGQFVPSEKPCIAKEIIKCTPGVAGDPCADPALNAQCKSISCNALIKDYVDPGIKVLTALMGVVVAASIIVAGIQYGSSASDPGKVAAAKKRLTSAILALLSYLFMFAFLQWLLPGGVL